MCKVAFVSQKLPRYDMLWFGFWKERLRAVLGKLSRNLFWRKQHHINANLWFQAPIG